MSTEPTEPTGPTGPNRGFRQYVEVVTGSLEDKKRYRQYKARIKKLPDDYRVAAEAVDRYLMYFGHGDGADATAMHEDLIDLLEQSAANGTPIREVFGADPVEFVETFLRNYAEGRWRARERDRFVNAIKRAAGEEDQTGAGTVQ